MVEEGAGSRQIRQYQRAFLLLPSPRAIASGEEWGSVHTYAVRGHGRRALGREGTECKSSLRESGWAEAGPLRYGVEKLPAEPNAKKIPGLGILHQFLDCRESRGISARHNWIALVGVLPLLPPFLRGGESFNRSSEVSPVSQCRLREGEAPQSGHRWSIVIDLMNGHRGVG
jgi:hypothetical protein